MEFQAMSEAHSLIKNKRNVIGYVCALLIVGLLVGCAVFTADQLEEKKDLNEQLESQWGVRVESIRLTAAGHLVDFRYRVVDPEKAAALMKRGGNAYLVDESTETRLPVPVTKVGQLRGTGTMPKENRVYTVMFNSGNGLIQSGSRVSVVIGDFRAEHLTVE